MKSMAFGTRVWRLMRSVLLMSLLTTSAALAAPSLQLDPVGGAISGAPGTTVGWGFTISNSSAFIVVTSATFTGSPPPGTFTDFIAAFNFIVVGPSPETSPVSQSFNAVSQTGVGSFAISAGASPGTTSGQIELTYDLFSHSPNDSSFDPNTDTLSTDNILSADASITVVGPTFTATATNTSTATATPTAIPTNTAIPNGGSCSSGPACASGFCVDLVCCESACAGPRDRCNLPGQRGTCVAEAPAAAPALTRWGLLAASGLLASIAALALRRRARAR